MPLKKCSANGTSGWQWGNKGKCYTGPDAKKKALKQGFAEGPDKFKEEVSKGRLVLQSEIDEVELDIVQNGFPDEPTFANPFLEAIRGYVSKEERDKMSDDDFGWPEKKRYPVKDQKHLDAAVKLLGRAPKEKQASIKKKLIEIAKRKNLKLPDSWSKK